eukprot:6856632-Alexandrium_andersonii.AAC.1
MCIRDSYEHSPLLTKQRTYSELKVRRARVTRLVFPPQRRPHKKEMCNASARAPAHCLKGPACKSHPS